MPARAALGDDLAALVDLPLDEHAPEGEPGRPVGAVFPGRPGRAVLAGRPGERRARLEDRQTFAQRADIGHGGGQPRDLRIEDVHARQDVREGRFDDVADDRGDAFDNRGELVVGHAARAFSSNPRTVAAT